MSSFGDVRDLDSGKGEDVPSLGRRAAVRYQHSQEVLKVARAHVVGDSHGTVADVVGPADELDGREHAVAEKGVGVEVVQVAAPVWIVILL